MTFRSLFIYVKQLHLALGHPILVLSRAQRPSITAGSKCESLGTWRAASKRGGGEEKNKIKNARHAGRLTNVWPRLFCTLQSTAIHSGAILSAFFSFIPKLLKTTLWIGRWSMSFLLHAISHHPCPPPPAYIHTSFNSNRKSKWREKGKSAQLEHFSRVSSGNKSPGVLSSSG